MRTMRRYPSSFETGPQGGTMGGSVFGRRMSGPTRASRWIVAATALAASCGSAGGRGEVGQAALSGQLGQLPLIPKRAVEPLLLGDGTPVWEIRHADGSVTVVGAVARPTPEAATSMVIPPLPGLEVVAEWLKPN